MALEPVRGGRADHPDRNRNSVLYVDAAHHDQSDYTRTGGIDLSSASYVPDNAMHGLLLGDNGGADASGNVHVVMAGGGEIVFPFFVAAGNTKEFLRGCVIAQVVMTTTTYTGAIWPLW
jgi:hypothetical protein